MWVDKDGNIAGSSIIVNIAGEGEEPRLLRVFNPTAEQYIQAGYHWEDPPEPTPDPEYERRYQEYLVACGQFRTVCGMIKEFAGLDKFTGGFDEAMDFIQSAPFMANIVQGTYLFSLWQGADKAATYAADKIGLGQPEWWYDCWEQVINSQTPTENPPESEDITSDTQQVEDPKE